MTTTARIGISKLVGMLGSDHAGERDNALTAASKALAGAGLSWGWVGRLVADGELPGGDREKLLTRLVADRLREGLVTAWAMSGEEAKFVRDVLARCASGLSEASCADLERALQIAGDVRRRAGR